MAKKNNVALVKESEGREASVAGVAKGRSVATGKRTQSAFAELTVSSQVSTLFQNYAGLGYALSFETLAYVEILSAYNPDFSQAVDNVRSLANSGHNLFVDANKRAAIRIKQRLEEKARVIQSSHGGVDGLIDKLLDQAAVYGAMCGEWVVNDNLDDVIDFIDVNPKHIRYFWDEDLNRFVPFQKINARQQQIARDRGQEIRNGCARLNEATFHYCAFDSAPGSPYGTPPFLAALPNIAIQRDMINNMAQIVKKVGLLGIIDLSVQSLPPKPGETDAQFASRAGKYLDDYVIMVEDMVRDGGVVHYDDVEASTYNITGNAAGATNIFKQNEELIFSGLKSMPSVQGRSYSSTETYAGVAYDIIIRNTYKYQRAVKRMIEAGYWLMVTLWGETPDGIRLEFLPNKSLHRLQDAQAFRLEIFNQLLLWAMGIIKQHDVAQSLGYQEPSTEYEVPPDSPLIHPPQTVGISAKSGDDSGVSAKSMNTDEILERLVELLQESELVSVT